MDKLTKAEEKIMHILWSLKKGFVKDVIAEIPPPKPAYNTVSSIIRILVDKGFVKYREYGKTHEYYPAVSKKVYRKFTFKHFLKDYFEGSYQELVSFMAQEEKLSHSEIEDLLENIKPENNQKAGTE